MNNPFPTRVTVTVTDYLFFMVCMKGQQKGDPSCYGA